MQGNVTTVHFSKHLDNNITVILNSLLNTHFKQVIYRFLLPFEFQKNFFFPQNLLEFFWRCCSFDKHGRLMCCLCVTLQWGPLFPCSWTVGRFSPRKRHVRILALMFDALTFLTHWQINLVPLILNQLWAFQIKCETWKECLISVQLGAKNPTGFTRRSHTNDTEKQGQKQHLISDYSSIIHENSSVSLSWQEPA